MKPTWVIASSRAAQQWINCLNCWLSSSTICTAHLWSSSVLCLLDKRTVGLHMDLKAAFGGPLIFLTQKFIKTSKDTSFKLLMAVNLRQIHTGGDERRPFCQKTVSRRRPLTAADTGATTSVSRSLSSFFCRPPCRIPSFTCKGSWNFPSVQFGEPWDLLNPNLEKTGHNSSCSSLAKLQKQVILYQKTSLHAKFNKLACLEFVTSIISHSVRIPEQQLWNCSTVSHIPLL